MVQKNLEKQINKMCSYLEFYDKNGFFPFEKEKISITLSKDLVKKIRRKKNMSRYVESLILKN